MPSPEASFANTSASKAEFVIGSAEKLERSFSMAPRWLTRLLEVCIGFTAIFLPLAFGGAHAPVYLSFEILFFSLTGLTLVVAPSVSGRVFDNFAVLSNRSWVLNPLVWLGAFCLYPLLQFFYLSNITQTHPVLGIVDSILNREAFWQGVIDIFWFLSCFWLSLLLLSDALPRVKRLETLLCFGAVLVSLVALMHWFYDNGKLFWIFSPYSVQVSERARWPFVNPNHLADFLLPSFFLLLGKLNMESHLIYDQVLRQSRSQRGPLYILASSKSLQRAIVGWLFRGLALLVVAFAILGSLSRGAWGGAAAGLLVFFLGDIYLRKEEQRGPVRLSASRQPGAQRVRRRRRNNTVADEFWFVHAFFNFPRLVRLMLVGGMLIGMVFLFGSRGTELFIERLNYGLMYSLRDIRWQLSSDSLSMLLDHALFGVGLGGWAVLYPALMSPVLAGLNPVYLHSDPLQLLIELGVVGITGIASFIWLTARYSILSLSHSTIDNRHAVLALFSGLTAMLAASLVEFPFRMLAIDFYAALYLSVLYARIFMAAR